MTIEVIDHTEQTEEQELVEDFIQIVTVFSCRKQGKRANKAKKMMQELIEKVGWMKTSESLPVDVKYTNPRIHFDGKYWYLSVGGENECSKIE